MGTTEDEKAEAIRTVLALARASLTRDEEAAQALIADAGERELRTLAFAAAGVISDFLIRLSAAHEVLGRDEGAFICGGDITEAVLADPAALAVVEANIAATQARLTGQD